VGEGGGSDKEVGGWVGLSEQVFELTWRMVRTLARRDLGEEHLGRSRAAMSLGESSRVPGACDLSPGSQCTQAKHQRWVIGSQSTGEWRALRTPAPT
jgi:hypothetical protein